MNVQIAVTLFACTPLPGGFFAEVHKHKIENLEDVPIMILLP